MQRSHLRRCYHGFRLRETTTTIVDNPAAARELFDGARYALLDCGGTLWNADKPLPGIHEALDYMRHNLGLKLRFVTNNATMSREATLASKFRRLGFIDVKIDEIFSSAYASQVVLRRYGSDGRHFDRGNVLVLGNDGLIDDVKPALAPGRFAYGAELKTSEGCTNCHGEPLLVQSTPYDIRVVGRCWTEPLLPPPYSWSSSTHRNRGVALRDLQIAAVVMGIDFKFTPTALALGAMALQQHRHTNSPRALFVATNRDPQMPIPGGWLMPGCGSFVAALETAAARKPDVVCGKPTTKMFRLFQEAEEMAGAAYVNPAECVVIGDRLTTDVAFGNGVGARTVLVETGCETLDDIPPEGSMSEGRRRRHIPHFSAKSLPAIIDLHRATRVFAVGGRVPGAHALSQAGARWWSLLRDFDADELDGHSNASGGPQPPMDRALLTSVRSKKCAIVDPQATFEPLRRRRHLSDAVGC